ncbi:RNA binding protein [Zostera marina]|uniref:RNA binding protein n=1 Tax=Zostera marina TaxID=29655 RepID=A0A0K9PK79_ZOSMR|nr:RNA binding protein [Zostera marina]
MANSYPPTVTAVQIGNFFVGQYYQVLQKNPDIVHQFYTDGSNMTVIDGSMVETAKTTLEIHSLIMSLNFKTIEIKTAHSMESLNGGVLVVISGSVKIKELHSKQQRFMQTFFLAPQDKGYFILNDVIQFIDDEQVKEHPTTLQEYEHYRSEQKFPNHHPETDYMLGGEFQCDDFVPQVRIEETEPVEMYNIPEHQKHLYLSEMDSIVEKQIQDLQVEDLSMTVTHSSTVDVVKEPIKHTYASILRTSKAQSRQYAVPPLPGASARDEITQPVPVQTVVPQPEKSITEVVEYPLLDEEGEVTSVYVRNLSSSDSASELEYEFKNFGKIKPDGVQIKSKKDVGVYYAFIEFEDNIGVQNALKAASVFVNGREIHIEERRPNAGSSRGRRGRGRGGYHHSQTTRGRFGGGRSFGGGGFGQDAGASKDYYYHTGRSNSLRV